MKESRDILTLFESLNSHEVFTPPRIARQMLDLLPASIWNEPALRLLDPCTKSGVFLREAFFRFFDGLAGKGEYLAADGKTYNLNDRQQRINHILKNMLFGIATSELTGYIARRTLYGVMCANSDKQLAALESFEKSTNFHQWTEEEKYNFVGRNTFNEYFDHNLFCTPDYEGFEEEGNIFYPNDEVKKLVMEEDDYVIEDKYFPFIEENTKHKKILDIRGGVMKFDVIIGNPPYQKSDGGGRGTSAIPVYQKFIENALSLHPRYITMITPSRWFSGGKGLDSFRKRMLNEKKIRIINDFPEASDCFPGVQIKGGVSFFLWDKEHNGECEFVTRKKDTVQSIAKRHLLEEGLNTLIRFNEAIPIYRKVKALEEPLFYSQISSRKPFGIESNFDDFIDSYSQDSPVKLYRNGNPGFISIDNVNKNRDLIKNIKVLISKSGSGSDAFPHQILGRPFVAEENTACTETFLILRSVPNKEQAYNITRYVQTKFFRFLVSLIKNTQNAARGVYRLVPDQDFNIEWTDEKLYEKYGITLSEQMFIDSIIKPLE